MKYDTERYRKIYEAMSPEEIAEVNRKNDEEHKKQAEAFQAGYKIYVTYAISHSKLLAKIHRVCIGYYVNASLRKKTFLNSTKNMVM